MVKRSPLTVQIQNTFPWPVYFYKCTRESNLIIMFSKNQLPLLLKFLHINIIIIIINFYGTYILRNLSSEAQQNSIIKHNCEQGCAKVSIRTRDN